MLRFIIGSATSNKSEQPLHEIKQMLKEAPQGPPIIYLVPEQMTFQQEYALLKDEDLTGSIRAQVYSFTRLAWRLMQLTGGATKKFITSSGIQMMLRKIIEERNKDEWKIFKKAIEKQGFIEQLETMITEFKRYCVTPEMMKEQLAEMDMYQHLSISERALQEKLDDLVYIYEQLTIALEKSYIDSEDQLQILADKLAQSDFLKNTSIYIDGFHQFTPQELLVIEEMLKQATDVTITLTMDDIDQLADSPLDLFYQTQETYQQLKELAEKWNIPSHIETIDPSDKFHPAFVHIDAHFDDRPVVPFDAQAPIRIAEAVHPRAEVEGAAQEIVRLVRDEDYRYRDIAILLREPEVYHDLITTIFADYRIPVFIDEKKTMLNHPLIESIRSLLDVIEGNWRYDAVFRLLKAGFIPEGEGEFRLTQDAIDELENYVLEYGIRGRDRWFADEPWIFQRFRGFDQGVQTDREKEAQERINAYREKVKEALQEVDSAVREAETIREKAIVLFYWLEKIKAPERLESIRESYDQEGRGEKAREQEQVWNALIQLLEELTEIAGEESVNVSKFRNIIEAGLETLSFSHVPPSLDHVVVGSIDRSRMNGIRVALLLGVNEGTWPMKQGEEGLMNEEERSLLEDHGIKIAEGSKRKLMDDWLYVYLAVTLPTDYLWVSYPISNEEGKQKIASSVIKRLQELCPIQEESIILQDPEEMVIAERFVTTPEKTRGALTAQLSRKLRGYPIDPIWDYVLNWYLERDTHRLTNQTVLQSLFYENKPSNLSKQVVKEMYPKEIKASISRLEMFYRCSYQHFARYGLGLEERPIYKLDAPDVGQLFHEALRQITEWIRKERKQFADLDEQTSQQYAHRAMRQLAPILQNQILHSSNRYKYIQQKLENVIARATYILSEQARQTSFSPIGLEVEFGYPNKLEPLRVTLPNDYELVLRGRIDRVDQAIINDHLYLRIVDYKSSSTGLNLAEVYYGLALQMLAYLDVVLKNSEQWLGQKASPAGVLYFHVHNPMLTANEKWSEEKVEEELFKKFKMDGLLTEDVELIKQMDTSLDSGRSNIVPVGIGKAGQFYKGSRVTSEENLTQLQSYIYDLMKQAGLSISSGEVELNPYQKQQQTACTYCVFRSVCQFDPTLEENEYRRLQDLKDEEVLERVRRGNE